MRTITRDVKLVPLKSGHSTISDKDYYEQILIQDNDYPCAMVHIDLFFVKERQADNEIYKALESGKSVSCKMQFKLMEQS